MPFTIKADPAGQGIAIMGLISLDELPAFQEAFGQAFRELRGDKTANWHPVFINLMMTVGGENSQKINAIKLGRLVSHAELKTAKDYIEAIETGRKPLPTGFEFPDMDSDELRHFTDRLPAEKVQRHPGNWRKLFLDAIMLAQNHTPTSTGTDNVTGVPDPYGFKVLAIKMWRAIASDSRLVGFAEAKSYVEILILGNQDWPEGFEHGDLSDDAMAVFARDYQQACEMADRGM